MPSLPNKLIKIGDAAKILGVSIRTLRYWEEKGLLSPAKTPGGTRMYRLSDIENFNSDEPVKLIKIGEVAEKLGVSVRTIRYWEEKGLLNASKSASGTRMYRLSDIDNFDIKVANRENSIKLQNQLRKPVDFSRNEANSQQGGLSSRVTSERSQTSSPEIATVAPIQSGLPRNDEKLGSGLRNKFGMTRKGETDKWASPFAQTRFADSSRRVQSGFAIEESDQFGSEWQTPDATIVKVSKQINYHQLGSKALAVGIFPVLIALLGWLALTSSYIFNTDKTISFMAEKMAPRTSRSPLAALGWAFDRSSAKVAEFVVPQKAEVINKHLAEYIPIEEDVAGATQSGAVLAATNPNFKLDISVDTSVEGTLSAKSLRLSDTVSQIVMGENLTISANQQTAPRVATIPVLSGDSTFLFTDQSQTVTNKIISGSTNTLSNIANSALTNSGVTISTSGTLTGGGVVALGGTITLTGAASGVTSLTAGTDISVSGSTGGVTVSNSSTLSSVTGRGATTTTALTLNGAVAMGSTLGVTGATTLSSTLTAVGNVGIGTTNVSSALLAVGSSSQLLVNSTGNLTKINNVAYSWPSSSAGANNYVLTAQTDGTLAWTTGSSVSVPWNSIDDPDGNQTLAMAANTTTWNWATATTGNQLSATANALTTGTLFDLSSTSTAGDGSKLLSLTRSGTNGTASKTNYGLYSAITNTGTTSTNIAGYFSATGGTNNYAGIFEAGNVGIGTTSPWAQLAVNNAVALNTPYNMASFGYSGGATNRSINIQDILDASTANQYIWFNGALGSTSTRATPTVTTANSYPAGLEYQDNQFSIVGSTTIAGTNSTISRYLTVIPSSGNVGIGTTSPGAIFDVQGIAYINAGATINLAGSTQFLGRLTPDAVGYMHGKMVVARDTAGSYKSYLAFYTESKGSGTTDTSTEKMRIDSAGNVGIGITPTSQFHVAYASGNTGPEMRLGYNNDASTSSWATKTLGVINFMNHYSLNESAKIYSTSDGIADYAGGDLYFQTRPSLAGSLTTRMYIDSGGNVGIGTTAPTEILRILGSASIATGAYTSTGNILISGDSTLGPYIAGNTDSAGNSTVTAAGMRVQYGGLGFKVAYSGSTTAGSARTFTDAMIVTTAGNVGIGTTNPVTKTQIGIEVTDDNSFSYDSNALMVVHQTPTATATLNDPKNVLFLGRQGTGGEAYGAAAMFNLSRYENSGTNSRTRLDISLANTTFDASSNNVMTLLSNGNVGIGATSPGYKLQVAGETLVTNYMTVSDALSTVSPSKRPVFQNIHQGSHWRGFLVGFNAYRKSDGNYEFTGDGANNESVGIWGAFDLNFFAKASSGGSTVTGDVSTYTRMTIGGSGTITFSSALGTGTGGNYLCINTTTYEVLRGNGSACTASSARFKENVANLDYGLKDIMQLRPVSYEYKVGTNMGEGTKLGFIAEEMQKVLPEVVTYDNQGQVFGLDYPVLTSVLTKGIQEIATKTAAAYKINPEGVLEVPALKVGKLILDPNLDLSGNANAEGTLSYRVMSIEDRLRDLENGVSNPNGPTFAQRIDTLASQGETLQVQIASQSAQLTTVKLKTDDLATSIASTSGTLAKLQQLIDGFLNNSSSSDSREVTASDSANLADTGSSSPLRSNNNIDDLNLTPPEVLIASGSATLANIDVSHQVSAFRFKAEEATISGTLRSFGETLLGNTMVAGSFSQDGTFSISNGNSINVIGYSSNEVRSSSGNSSQPSSSNNNQGILYLQNSPLASGLDLFNGKITMNIDGNLTVNNLTVRAVANSSHDPTIGSGKILAGTNKVVISNNQIKPSSKVFVTPRVKTGGRVLAVDQITDGSSFSVSTDLVTATDIDFDWWIVGTE